MTMDRKQEAAHMNVSLTPELEKFVSIKVDSGRYTSASEVVREALRLLEEHDRSRSAQIAAFNKELGHRLASLDRGERIDPAAARKRIEAKSHSRRKMTA
jgi:antitoxin ParD1/3/4